MTECLKCGEQRPCTFTIDPYMHDVHGEEVDLGFWCEECLDDSAAEI